MTSHYLSSICYSTHLEDIWGLLIKYFHLRKKHGQHCSSVCIILCYSTCSIFSRLHWRIQKTMHHISGTGSDVNWSWWCHCQQVELALTSRTVFDTLINQLIHLWSLHNISSHWANGYDCCCNQVSLEHKFQKAKLRNSLSIGSLKYFSLPLFIPLFMKRIIQSHCWGRNVLVCAKQIDHQAVEVE